MLDRWNSLYKKKNDTIAQLNKHSFVKKSISVYKVNQSHIVLSVVIYCFLLTGDILCKNNIQETSKEHKYL